MNNRDYVRGAYDEIHAPDALFGKVMNMKKEKNNMRNMLKYAAAAFGVFAITFVASNGICYAATGETWVSKAIVYINGEKQEEEIILTRVDNTLVGEMKIEAEEGAVYQIVECPIEDDMVVEDVQFEFTDDNVDELAVDNDATGAYISENNVPELKSENGNVYLVVADETVDITMDFADGEATGQISYDGKVVNYTVTGTIDDYQISFEEE